MRKRAEAEEKNAYLTVYLALCVTLILSLCLTLIEGARRNGARLETEIAAEISVDSVLAEYHRELFYQYNLFAVDSSYGTTLPGKVNTERHLQYYLEKNLSAEDVFLGSWLYRDFFGLSPENVSVTKVSVLTDAGGAVFRRCAADAIKDDVGLGLLDQLQDWIRIIEVNGLEERDIEEEMSSLDGEIQEYDGMEFDMGEEEPYVLSVVNPAGNLEAQKRKGILKLVLEEDGELSANAIRTEGLILDRMSRGQVSRGNMAAEQLSESEQLLERFFFQEYLMRYMGHYGSESEEDALRYQLEYLAAGKESDVENLRSVLNRICVIREAANTLYLYSDSEKSSMVKLAATLVCDLAMVPELAPVLEAAILLGWAYAESIYDIRILLAGGKVPLLKSAETWHYSLENALSGSMDEPKELGTGLSYDDYLRVFLMCTDLDTLTARAMNMVEADIRLTPGNGAFRLDGCYAGLEAYMKVESGYGFDFEVTRQKAYIH
ncbi:MAG: DUF5702 domain-containing protein [Eubacterium sp.]|nr:DUF5702 domain-containing protein [Eubacterium sp.]MCM1214513.1 DUF5702 domain-containing protein [Lachnospiraceae bacterium]MCM1303558.1 DUF5702 domain-containing protein [Butyrivibrio sp.]MCM1343282.1 DUF5702 domain-containing protein [Muribaculaceae bacterium]MCM1238392.1 DUF5702 domain-containing protein [Lachnospiraceae bacterium]